MVSDVATRLRLIALAGRTGQSKQTCSRDLLEALAGRGLVGQPVDVARKPSLGFNGGRGRQERGRALLFAGYLMSRVYAVSET